MCVVQPFEEDPVLNLSHMQALEGSRGIGV